MPVDGLRERGTLRRAKYFFVYILASDSGCLYTGLTTNLERRLCQHRAGTFANAFTRRYRVTKLVYYEVTCDGRVATTRERQLKAWSRAKRVALIESMNRDWRDLAVDWPASRP